MMWYGKKKVEPVWSMNTGRLPSIMRTFVHTRPASACDGRSNRSPSRGCSFSTWMHYVSDHVAMRRPARRRVTGPMVPPAVGTMRQPA